MTIKSLKTFDSYRFLYDDYDADFAIAASKIETGNANNGGIIIGDGTLYSYRNTVIANRLDAGASSNTIKLVDTYARGTFVANNEDTNAGGGADWGDQYAVIFDQTQDDGTYLIRTTGTNSHFLLEGSAALYYKSVTTDNTDANATITIAEMLGGIYLRGTNDGLTANRTDTTDTAANIVAGIKDCFGGASFEYQFWNKDSTHTLDIAAGSGVTLVPSNPSAVAANSSARHIVVVNVCTAASEAVTIYTVGDVAD